MVRQGKRSRVGSADQPHLRVFAAIGFRPPGFFGWGERAVNEKLAQVRGRLLSERMKDVFKGAVLDLMPEPAVAGSLLPVLGVKQYCQEKPM